MQGHGTGKLRRRSVFVWYAWNVIVISSTAPASTFVSVAIARPRYPPVLSAVERLRVVLDPSSFRIFHLAL